jgi:hypothetical protein
MHSGFFLYESQKEGAPICHCHLVRRVAHAKHAGVHWWRTFRLHDSSLTSQPGLT